MVGATPELAIELKGITKVFDAVIANSGVDLRVEKGTIHGVIGENGAGKSTAMKMLYGIHAPDAGEIRVHGISRQWKSPLDAIEAGIGMVHQHFMLAGPYTALDNIVLGAEPSKPFWKSLPLAFRPIDRPAARSRLETLSRQYDLEVPWDEPVERLPVGIQQRVEILKLLYRNADILILDEPTAVLTPHETHALFENLKKLRAEGKTILIITHKLKEVMSLTDRVTVFRAGMVMGEVETSRTSPQDLANLMVGRKVILNIEVPDPPPPGEPVLEVMGLTLRGDRGDYAGPGGSARYRLFDVGFQVRRGEIVGIAGVEGNGQSELLRALLHPSDSHCRSAGLIRIHGQDVTRMPSEKIRALGVGAIPEDRQREGLLLNRPVVENFLLGLQRHENFRHKPPRVLSGLRDLAGGFLSLSRIRSATERAMEEYDIRPRSIHTRAGDLSGGNQQKLIIAREFESRPGFLIAARPTRGVDVGAIELIHRRIVRARQEGVGVLLISSELDEILTLSDRILVMYEGKIIARYLRGQCGERELGLRMGGAASGIEGVQA